MIQFLETFTSEINNKKEYIGHNGLDQAILNYIVYADRLEYIGVTYEGSTQRLSSFQNGGFEYDYTTKVLTLRDSVCSPIIVFKIANNKQLRID